MRQWLAGVLPVARGGRAADPQIAAVGAVRTGTGQNAATRRSRPHHRLRGRHAAAGLHERDTDQPDLEPGLYSDANQSGLATPSPMSSSRTRGPIRRGGAVSRSGLCEPSFSSAIAVIMGPCFRRDDVEIFAPHGLRWNKFQITENLFPET